jgi:P-type conjugative transfer ATPase TrbB
MMARYAGDTVMAGIADDDVTEVYVNPHDRIVRYESRSRGKIATAIRLAAEQIEMFLNTVATLMHVTLTPDQPSLQAELPIPQFYGSRLQGFIPPAVLGACFTIRKPPNIVYTLDHYVHRGLLSAPHRALLHNAVVQRDNIVIAGGTSSGKTTFTNAVLCEITEVASNDRIIILEDTIELRCTTADHLTLRTTPTLSLAQLVKTTLRANPDRIVVGEVRDGAALDLLDAWATGHPGGCATLHATTPEGALLRLDRLAQRAARQSQVHLIVDAVQLVVMMQQTPTGRRVTEIARVRGVDHHQRFILEREVAA